MSICWECRNARADRCAWIGRKKRVWKRATEKRCRQDQDIWIVQECNLFDPEKGWVMASAAADRIEKLKTKKGLCIPEMDEQILAMREGGATCKEIASITGRATSTIYGRLRKLKKEGVERKDEKVSVGTS